MKAIGVVAASILAAHSLHAQTERQDTTAQVERGKQAYAEQRC